MTRRPAKKPRAALVLCLYVAGESPNSVLAKTNLRLALAHLPKQSVTLEIRDVLSDPDRASQDGVLVTPTLIKRFPEPQQRLIGNLRNSALLAQLALAGVPSD
ncbi:MAG: circadian clock KaiB family protein [Polyangiaceae bacterium]